MLSNEPKIESAPIYVPSKNSKKGNLDDCISIAAIEDGFVINKDGSIAVGFEVTLPEEERLDEDDFLSVISDFSAACKRLPAGTVIQKLDIYDEDILAIPLPAGAPFFHRKTLEHYDGKKHFAISVLYTCVSLPLNLILLILWYC